MKSVFFLFVVIITNIIQGITGFAGTILAMPVSVMLIGFNTAKPILNFLGILAGIYVVITSYKKINKKEFFKIISVMIFGIITGMFFKTKFEGDISFLCRVLGIIVILIALHGIFKSFLSKKKIQQPQNKLISALLLVSAGIIHGMFVCGGPLLVSYLTGRSKDKQEFRATISAVWVVLNTVIFIGDIRAGNINIEMLGLLFASCVALFAGMAIGSLLVKKISSDLFMKITYILLLLSGVSLLR